MLELEQISVSCSKFINALMCINQAQLKNTLPKLYNISFNKK